MHEPLPWEVDEAAVALPKDRLCIFRLGDRLLGIAGGHSKGLFPFERLTRAPRTPPYLLGIVNLRGEVAPVLDLSTPLGVGTGYLESAGAPGVIAEISGTRIVLAVDEMVGFEPIDLSQPMALGGGFGEELETFGRGCVEARQGNVVVLDLVKLLQTLKPSDVWRGSEGEEQRSGFGR